MGDVESEVSARNGSIPSLSEPIWQCITIGAAALFLEVTVRRRPGLLGIVGGPDLYWAFHWARDYSSGFERRALLGEIQRLFFDPTDYRIITMFSWASSLALYATVVVALLKLVRDIQAPIRLALLTVILISPATTGLIVETTGDPLQLVLALYFALVCSVFGCWAQPLSNLVIAATSFGVFATASMLVHEASIFFTLPCTLIIAFWRKSRFALVALVSHSLGAVLALAMLLLATERPDAVSSIPVIHIGSESVAESTAGFWLRQSFSSMLAMETDRLFGQGLRGYFEWSSIFTGSLLLPIFLIYLFISAYETNRARSRFRVAILFLIGVAGSASLAPYSSIKAVGYLACFFLLPGVLLYCILDRTCRLECPPLFPIFVTLVLFSAPLYVIAHDWARFLSYTLFCSLTLCAMRRETSRLGFPSILTPAISPLIGAGLLIAGFTATPLLGRYRYLGLTQDNFLGLTRDNQIFVAISVIIAMALLLKELDWSGKHPESPSADSGSTALANVAGI
jgi:hypothetical protein